MRPQRRVIVEEFGVRPEIDPAHEVEVRVQFLADYLVAVTGFFTKLGDGAADVMPLFGLNKRQNRELCRYLGAPEQIESIWWRTRHKRTTPVTVHDRWWRQ